MRRTTSLIALCCALVAPCAAADIRPEDWRQEQDGTTLRLVMTAAQLDDIRADGLLDINLSGGIFLTRYETEGEGVHWTVHSLLKPDGTELRLFSRDTDAEGGIQILGYDHGVGALWLMDGDGDLYILDGLPRTNAHGPGGPGDFHPGVEAGLTWLVEGDGEITIFDVIILLRRAVGIIEEIE